jgi:hypothetical protein
MELENEMELGFLFVNGGNLKLIHPQCVFALIKLVNFPEEERKRIKSCFKNIVHKDDYFGDCFEVTVDMHGIVDDTIDTFKSSFCQKYSIKQENIKLFYENKIIDTEETKSKTLKEMGMKLYEYFEGNKENVNCVWKGNDKNDSEIEKDSSSPFSSNVSNSEDHPVSFSHTSSSHPIPP